MSEAAPTLEDASLTAGDGREGSLEPGDQRILVLAPTGRDSDLARDLLRGVGLNAHTCLDMSSLCEQLDRGAAVALLSEEALDPHTLELLSRFLVRQPPWSDLPVVVLASAVHNDGSTWRTQRMLELLGNVTFMDRPVRMATLVTAMKAALRARNRQYAAREVLERLKRQESEVRRRADFEQHLIGIVSHDLRNPINAITLSSALLLRRDALSERERSIVSRILTSADRANRLIRDLLDFTQARLGDGIPLERRSADLYQILHSVVEELQASHASRTIRVSLEGTGQGDWDADRLAQVISNLISNALHYSPEGSVVRVRGGGGDDEVWLEIHNEGEPIPAEVLPHLFEPYKRGTRERSSTKSLGLGLFIVHQIVTAHGGTVHVCSSPEASTIFTLHLPRIGVKAPTLSAAPQEVA